MTRSPSHFIVSGDSIEEQNGRRMFERKTLSFESGFLLKVLFDDDTLNLIAQATGMASLLSVVL